MHSLSSPWNGTVSPARSSTTAATTSSPSPTRPSISMPVRGRAVTAGVAAGTIAGCGASRAATTSAPPGARRIEAVQAVAVDGARRPGRLAVQPDQSELLDQAREIGGVLAVEAGAQDHHAGLPLGCKRRQRRVADVD